MAESVRRHAEAEGSAAAIRAEMVGDHVFIELVGAQFGLRTGA